MAAVSSRFGTVICSSMGSALITSEISARPVLNLFRRLDGANSSVEIAETADVLKTGGFAISNPVVEKIGSGLPNGEYLVCLAQLPVNLVRPGDKEDYFAREQIDLWGKDGFWDLRHDPRVPYYRAGESEMGGHAKLFQFVVPMFPNNWLEQEVVSASMKQLEKRETPTAIALSVLDVKGPANWDEDNKNCTEHWCLGHYLLDGHHKIAAAYASGLPATILSFLSVSAGVSTREQVQSLISGSAG
jgi:hypothetical protein